MSDAARAKAREVIKPAMYSLLGDDAVDRLAEALDAYAATQTAALRTLVGREHRDRLGKSYSAHRVAFLMDSNLCDVCALLADPGSDKPC